MSVDQGSADGRGVDLTCKLKPGSSGLQRLKPGPGMNAEEVAENQRDRIFLATVELTAERGVKRLTVVEIAKRAGVSRRSFYQHFDGVDSCLIKTYDRIIRGVALALMAIPPSPGAWRERVSASIEAVCVAIPVSPEAARFALIEVLDAGPAALNRMRYSFGLFAALVGERIASLGGAPRVAPVFVRAIAPGLARVARRRLLAGSLGDLPSDAPALVDWTIAISGEDPDVPRQAAKRSATAEEEKLPSLGFGEREQILAAAEKIAIRQGAAAIDAATLAAAAGLSRARVGSRFASPSAAFLSALDRGSERIYELIDTGLSSTEDWAGGVHRGMAAICARWAADPDGARLAFVEQLAVGAAGIERRDRVLEEVAVRFGLVAHGTHEVAAAASLGAVWATIFELVAVGRAGSLPAMAPTLSYLLLAPALGPAEATRRIIAEILGEPVGDVESDSPERKR